MREIPEYFCKFMQTHEWMRRQQQQLRNGNRGEDRFRPRFYYLWISFINSALYIHTDCVYTQHTHTHTHTHDSGSQVAALQSWSIWKAARADTTPALQHCLHSLYLGELQSKNALYLHPFLWNKECEIVCHETDIPFVLLWALHCTLV